MCEKKFDDDKKLYLHGKFLFQVEILLLKAIGGYNTFFYKI